MAKKKPGGLCLCVRQVDAKLPPLALPWFQKVPRTSLRPCTAEPWPLEPGCPLSPRKQTHADLWSPPAWAGPPAQVPLSLLSPSLRPGQMLLHPPSSRRFTALLVSLLYAGFVGFKLADPPTGKLRQIKSKANGFGACRILTWAMLFWMGGNKVVFVAD